MKLPYITEDDLNSFKKNLPEFSEYLGCTDNKWIKEKLGSDFFRESRYEIPDIELDMSDKREPFKTDFENVRKIYEGIRLPASTMTDERIWAGLALGPFYDYVKYRWKKKDDREELLKQFKNNYLFGYENRRSLFRQAIARLWWIGKLTKDEKRDDPYELTKFVCEHPDFQMHLLDRTFSNNPKILGEFIEALKDAREDGYKINTDTVGELSKYINTLGGLYILDTLPNKEIYNKIMEKIRKDVKKE